MVDFSCSVALVIQNVGRIIEWRGKRGTIRVDNGPEYINVAIPGDWIGRSDRYLYQTRSGRGWMQVRAYRGLD